MQLQEMGERLAKASHESKAQEIEYKLGKVNDRWQHLLDLIAARYVCMYACMCLMVLLILEDCKWDITTNANKKKEKQNKTAFHVKTQSKRKIYR